MNDGTEDSDEQKRLGSVDPTPDLWDRRTMTDNKKSHRRCWRFATLQPFLVVLFFGCSGEGDPIGRDLPDISSFLIRPSDSFLVDLDQITGGHPFKGDDSPSPHAGVHAHFDNTGNRWPKGNDEPRNYPAIYAVADGTVGRLTTHFPLSGGNDRYGFDLEFAKDRSGATCRFSYSIEPMAAEPSEGFYKKFILVHDGQRVRKGDMIAYLYTPPCLGSHLRWHNGDRKEQRDLIKDLSRGVSSVQE